MSPEWAILAGQAPFYVIFTGFVLLTTFTRDWQFADALVRLASLELTLFNARVLFCGPGSLRVRIPLTLACAFASIFLFGWLKLAGTSGALEGWFDVVISTDVRISLAALVGPAIAAALGSRDCRYSSSETTDVARSNIPLVIGVSLALATALANVVGGLRLDGSIVFGFFFQSIVVALLGFLVVQTWRLGIRGIQRLLSWQTAVFAVGAFLIACGFITLLRTSIANPNMDVSVTLLVLLAFGVVPIAREFFLRWAGYRAINVYAERRRARRNSSS